MKFRRSSQTCSHRLQLSLNLLDSPGPEGSTIVLLVPEEVQTPLYVVYSSTS